jgi:antitoxin VapB
MPNEQRRTVSLFRNGRSQPIRIPKEFEFDGERAVIRPSPDGLGLILTPEVTTTPGTLAKVFSGWATENEEGILEFPEIAAPLPGRDDPFESKKMDA